MSTRSCIAVQHADGSVDAIYCHFDGYVEGVGEALITHHNSLEAAEKLVALGDCSVVNRHGEVIAYSRDKGEAFDGVKPKHYASLEEYGEKVDEDIDHNGYLYLWADGRWVVWGCGVEKKYHFSALNLGAAVASERAQRERKDGGR